MGGPGAAVICEGWCSTGLSGTGVGARAGGGREWVPREGGELCGRYPINTVVMALYH